MQQSDFLPIHWCGYWRQVTEKRLVSNYHLKQDDIDLCGPIRSGATANNLAEIIRGALNRNPLRQEFSQAANKHMRVKVKIRGWEQEVFSRSPQTKQIATTVLPAFAACPAPASSPVVK